MDIIEIFAPGKVNLTLNIAGKNGDMHLIDSVMATVSLADKITVTKRGDKTVSITFKGAGTESIDAKNNTAVKTVNLLTERFGSFGADIIIEKKLPIAGGMGGSSADCAGILRALDEMFGFFTPKGDKDDGIKNKDDKYKSELYKFAAKIGSDVPFLIAGGLARVKGTGNIIEPITMKKPLKLYITAAFPHTGCDTGKVYKKFDDIYKSQALMLCDNEKFVKQLEQGKGIEGIGLSNALTEAAAQFCPEIKEYLKILKSLGAADTVMTGSGSSVIGLFTQEETADDAVRVLKTMDINSEKITTAGF